MLDELPQLIDRAPAAEFPGTGSGRRLSDLIDDIVEAKLIALGIIPDDGEDED